MMETTKNSLAVNLTEILDKLVSTAFNLFQKETGTFFLDSLLCGSVEIMVRNGNECLSCFEDKLYVRITDWIH